MSGECANPRGVGAEQPRQPVCGAIFHKWNIAVQHLRWAITWLNSMQFFTPPILCAHALLPRLAGSNHTPPAGAVLPMSTAEALLTAPPAEVVLNALPHPVIVVGPNGKVVDANAAADAFFEASLPLLRRQALRDLVPFGSPLLTLVEQVRSRGAAVNEYKVDLGTPRNPGERLVDLQVAPLPEQLDSV